MRTLADGLWVVDHPEFSVGGLRLGTRTTVVRLADGTLSVHAPGPIADFDAIRAVGTVSALVFPNQLHHLHWRKAKEAFPDAKVLGVATLRAKQPELRLDEELGETVPAQLSGTLEMLRFDGADPIDERVFFHPASRTLLASDLAFNIRNATGLFRFAMWLNDANDKLCMTRLGKSQYLSDHGAAARSVDRICEAFDFDRLVISHGEVYEGGAREALRRAYDFARVQNPSK